MRSCLTVVVVEFLWNMMGKGSYIGKTHNCDVQGPIVACFFARPATQQHIQCVEAPSIVQGLFFLSFAFCRVMREKGRCGAKEQCWVFRA